MPFGPTVFFTLSNCVLRHDIPEVTASSQAYPHIILDNLNTKIGGRIFKSLQCFFPIPKPDSRRLMTFKNENDFISFRHHTYTKEKGILLDFFSQKGSFSLALSFFFRFIFISFFYLMIAF